MLVHSYDSYLESAEFDPVTGELATSTATPEQADARHAQACGSYGFLGATRVVLYREADTLLLRIAGQVIPLAAPTRIRHVLTMDSCTLTVQPGDDPASGVELHYPTFELFLLDEVVNPFAEAEHHDFGLFIAQLAQNPDRAAALYPSASAARRSADRR